MLVLRHFQFNIQIAHVLYYSSKTVHFVRARVMDNCIPYLFLNGKNELLLNYLPEGHLEHQ